MKNNHLPSCLIVAFICLSQSLSAQCGIDVDAGEDITICAPLTPINLNGSINGSFASFSWVPPNAVVTPNSLQTGVWVSQTTSFVLKARTNELMPNMVVNPGFEDGNTGFYNSLNYSPGDLTHPNTYDVLKNPQAANDALSHCADHTSGDGNMLASTTSYTPGLPTLWCQTVPVTPYTDYYFSYWATRLISGGTTGVYFYINGQFVSNLALSQFFPDCEWYNGNGVWNSGANTSANICIRSWKFAGAIGLDDIFFAPFCETTDTVTVFVKDVKAVATPVSYVLPCEGYPLTLSGAGSSVGPDYTYQWQTPNGNIVSGQNTLNPIVDAPGTYILTVTLQNGVGDCIKKATAEVEVTNPLQVGIVAPFELNCYLPHVILKGISSQPLTSTYQWTAGQGGNIIQGANSPNAYVNQPGDYTLLVTNTDNGCTVETTVSIEAPNLPVATATAAPITCASPNTTLSGAGSSIGPNIQYAWSTTNGNIASGQNNLNAIGGAPGIYVLSVTNATNNCATTDTVAVLADNASIPVNILAAGNITCLQNAVVLATDSVAAGPHRIYTWTAIAGGNIVSGANSLAPVVNAPGMYVLLVTDTLNACTGTDTVAVSADNDAVIAIANAPALLTCVNTSVVLDAAGSSDDPLLVYQWSTSDGHIVGGGDTPAPTVDAPGTYTLLLSNPANGCSATDAAEVIRNIAAPPVSILPASPLSCAQPLLSLLLQNASPGGNFSYEWTASNGGHIFNGSDTAILCVDAAGTYSLLVTDLDNGCATSLATEVTADFNAPDIALAAPGILNCNTTSVNLLNSGMTDLAFLDHQWTLPDGSGVNTGTAPNLSVTQPGTYNLLVSNTQNGCTATASVTVVQHDKVVTTLTEQQNATCFGALNGVLGIAADGGNGAYTYLWSNGADTPVAANLAAGTYTVTVTDGENCSAVLSAAVTEPSELIAGASATPLSVAGASDGTATADPQGGTSPYIFAWDNGSTMPALSGLAAGFYTVTVTDAHNCTDVQTVEVWGGDCVVSATLQAVDPLCHGIANGQATATPVGGSAPYTYLWTTGSTEQTATNLPAGTHGVTLTDANGCPFSGIVTLTDPAPLTLVVANTVDAVCPGSSEGSATVLASGGTGPATISWENGQSGPVATGLSAGTYTAVAADANGCTTSTTATIQAIDPEPPLITAGAVIIPLGPSGSVELSLQNLGATVTDNCAVAGIQIIPDEFDCFDLGEQQVSIAAQDNSGNNSSKTITVTFVDIEVPVLECPDNIVRCAANNQVEYPAPVAIDNCLILGGTFSLVAGLPSGAPFPQGTTTNIYTYADFSGNLGACDFQVTILSPLSVGLDTVIHDIAQQNIGGIQVTVAGSLPGYTYEWLQNGVVVAVTEDLSGIGAGVYSLWVTDAAGCKTEAGPFEVSNLVRTDNPKWAEYIAVYPNPSSGQVFAVLPEELLGAEVDFAVLDAQGRKVMEQRGSGSKRVELDMSGLPNGLYSVLIRVEQGQVVRKIVIHR